MVKINIRIAIPSKLKIWTPLRDKVWNGIQRRSWTYVRREVLDRLQHRVCGQVDRIRVNA